ncbi:SRPBCC family protein [Trujillonella endophytica]|uniref:Polyketide cyclase / dehydrase and lipid transport n=1 Tax=Trujillonella endophytica TaxID=673521 RepID=A0A1H8SCD9_9ACTN|nr:SRPBCC family protein [Trujillella endophytica]SEO75928.1 Polyketide cyclase / dehydrase and lipid transport [Trujillella endophytica]
MSDPSRSAAAEVPADAERIEVSRVVPASPAEVFAVLRDPQGHVDIDASGMLMDAEGEPVTAVGDRFVVHMDREALGDMPLGRYDIEVAITVYEPDRAIAWAIEGALIDPPLGHVYGYRLEPAEGGTRVTSYCDWSNLREDLRPFVAMPIVPESALKATLGILDRTVRRRRSRAA